MLLLPIVTGKRVGTKRSRGSAVNTSLTNQFIFDSFFNIKMARPMPMYSVPGSIDHF